MGSWTPLLAVAARMAPICLVAVVIQTTVFVDVRVAGVSPELVAVVAVVSGLYGGPLAGLACGFVGGLLYDCWLTTPLGLAALVYAAGGYVVGSVQGTLHEPTWWLSALAGGLGSAALTLAYALCGEVIGQNLVDSRLGEVVVMVAISGTVLGPLVVVPLRWASDPLLGSRAKRRRDGAPA